MTFNIEKAKKIVVELQKLTDYKIYPFIEIDEERKAVMTQFFDLSFKLEELELKENKKKALKEELDIDDKEIDNLLEEYISLEKEEFKKMDALFSEYCQLINKDEDKKDIYNYILTFALGKLDEYKHREKMHRIYKTKIAYKRGDGNESTFSLYDMSILKLQEAHGDNDRLREDDFFKNPPPYIIFIEKFKNLIVPFNFETVYLFNKEDLALLDLRTEKITLIRAEDLLDKINPKDSP
jgi:hypothetical protein